MTEFDRIDIAIELEKVAKRNHDLAIKVVTILNLGFTVSDFFTVPQLWFNFLIVRCIATFLFFSVFLMRNHFSIPTEIVTFIAYLACILENAYMYSVIDAPALEKFTFAYIATFIGAGMMAVWKPFYSVMAVIIGLIINVILVILFSPLTAVEIISKGGFLTFMVGIFSIILIHARYTLISKEIFARLSLSITTEKLALRNQQITDSIHYANRIQQALLPPDYLINEIVKEYFIFFKPRDIVSGDFYWVRKMNFETFNGSDPHKIIQNEIVIIAIADCTGHGVPGAFMSMLGMSFLTEISNLIVDSYSMENHNAAWLLNELRKKVKTSLRQTGKEGETKDGMDIALCILDLKNYKLQYSGAYNPLYFFRNNELIEFRATKNPIGTFILETPFKFEEIEIRKNDIFYMFSDGFHSQFGGENDEKFKTKHFKDLLSEIHLLPMTMQKQKLEQKFNDWKGNTAQTDDVLVMGVRI